jgi:hypothetical protein
MVTLKPGHALLSCALAAMVGLLPVNAYGAAPIRECGNYGWTEDGQGPKFTFEEIDGAGTWNITTRVASCRTARRVHRRWSRDDGRYCNAPRFTRCRILRFDCRRIASGYEWADWRCTRAGGRVVRWQTGA